MDKRNRGWITVATFVLGLLGVLWLSGTDTRSTMSQAAGEAADPPKPVEVKPPPKPVVRESVGINVVALAADSEIAMRTPEQARLAVFLENTLVPLVSEIASTYPIDDLRAEFRNVFSKDTELNFALSDYVASPDVMARCVGPGSGHSSIELYVPKLEREYRRLDRDTFTDLLVGVILHEYRHFQTTGCNKDVTKESAAQNESETWWWVCDHVFMQMVQHGRLQGLPPGHGTGNGFDAYRASQGDINAPEWKAFMKKTVNLEH